MTEPKYITGKEAAKALIDGARVRVERWPQAETLCLEGDMADWTLDDVVGSDSLWEVVHTPATDANLVAAMRLYEKTAETQAAAVAWRQAAAMLEKRSLKP